MVTHLQAYSSQSKDSKDEPASISVQKQREIYQKAYKHIQKYSEYAHFSEDREQYAFKVLFVDTTLHIANDLMSLSHEASLSVNDYVNTLIKAQRVDTEVKNLKKVGDIQENEKSYTLRVSFEKVISFSKGGTYFNSEAFFDEPYKLIADITIDKKDGKCLFSRLTFEEGSNSLDFPEQYRVLVQTKEKENERNYNRDNDLYIGSKKAERLWHYNTIILHDGDEITYKGTTLGGDSIGTDGCGGTLIHAKYEDRNFRVRANVGHSLMGFNMLDGAKPGIVSNDGETSLGLDVGYIIPSDGKFFAGIYAGVGLSKNDLSITMKPEGDVYIPSEADEDGDSYLRHYMVEGEGIITQKFSAAELSVPLYADFEYEFIKRFSVYANLGARFQFTEDTWEAQISQYTTFGQYENAAYGSLMIINRSDELNLNGFGTHKPGILEVDRSGMKSNTSICALMGLGLRADINKLIAVDAGAQYLMGGYSWKKSDESAQLFSYSLPDGWESMNAEEKAKGDKVNLLSQIDGIKRNAFRLTLGLILKF